MRDQLTDEAIDLARDLRGPEAERKLRQGIVTAVNADRAMGISVRWGSNASATPRQRHLASYTPNVNDVVWGLREGDDTLVLGTLSPAPVGGQQQRTLAISRTAPTGTDQTQATGTTLATLGACFSGLQCGALASGPRLIRVSFKLWAFGHDTNAETYYKLQAAPTPSGTRSTVGEHRHVRVANAAPSPYGSIIFRSSGTDPNLSLWLAHLTLSGTATHYFQHATDATLSSWFLAEDIGPA